MAWYNNNWNKRRKVTVSASEVDSNLSNFPVYVDIGSISGISNAGAIRVTKADGSTELAREIVSSNEMHFKADSLSSSSDTEFYIYYDNPSASDYSETDAYGAQATWNNDYDAVYHFEETPNTNAGGIKDSTSNNAHATGVSLDSSNESSAPPLGKGISFDGSNDYIELPTGTLDLASSSDDKSTFAWIQTSTDDNPIISGRNSSDGNPIWDFMVGYNGAGGDNKKFLTHLLRDDNGNLTENQGSNTVADGSFYHVGATRSSTGTMELWRNASSEGTASDGLTTGLTFDQSGIGAEVRWINDSFSNQEQRYMNGVIDEVRISGVKLSDTWIAATYTNQDTPTTFYTVGSEESQASATISVDYVNATFTSGDTPGRIGERDANGIGLRTSAGIGKTD